MTAIEHMSAQLERIGHKPTRQEMRQAVNRRHYEERRFGFFIRLKLQRWRQAIGKHLEAF